MLGRTDCRSFNVKPDGTEVYCVISQWEPGLTVKSRSATDDLTVVREALAHFHPNACAGAGCVPRRAQMKRLFGTWRNTLGRSAKLRAGRAAILESTPQDLAVVIGARAPIGSTYPHYDLHQLHGRDQGRSVARMQLS